MSYVQGTDRGQAALLRAAIENYVSARLAQETKGCRRRLISFGVGGCTFVRAFDKFPLMRQWRIHQRYFQ